MKKNISLLTTIIAALFILAGCGSVDKKAPLVPKDVAFTIHFNTNSLSSKLSWDEIRKSNWFNEMTSKENDSFTKKILEDPSSSGIETKEGLFVFARREANGSGYAGFTGYVKDAAAFEAFNKKLNKSEEIKTNKDLKSITFRDRGYVSWNENKFLYLIESNTRPGFPLDSTAQHQEPVKADLADVAYRIFHYKKDSLLIDDARFTSLMRDEGDVHFWSNAESLSIDNYNMGFMSLLNTEVYFRETATAASLSFDKGKILVHAKTYSNKEMRELMRKYSGDNLKTNYIQRIPSDNVAAVFAANYKPEGLKQLLKLGGLDGLVNSALGEYSLTLDQLVAASKGDILVAVTDFGIRKKMISLSKEMDSLPVNTHIADVLVCMSINNRAPFEKLVSMMESGAKSSALPFSPVFKIENDLFIAGTNSTVVDQYLKGGTKDFPFVSRMSGHPIAGYVDLNKLMTFFGGEMKDTSSNAFQRASVEMWKDVLMTGGEFKDDAIVQDVEITLVDQNTNSLQQLNNYIDKLSSARKKPF